MRAGRVPVAGVRVYDDLGAAAQRLVGDGVHVADDHVRSHAGVKQGVRAAVDAHDDRLEVAHVRPDDRQVALREIRAEVAATVVSHPGAILPDSVPVF